MVKTVAAVTLGCKVNQYDTEAMLEAFERHGYRIVPNGSPADVYLVNTCTVTGTGDKKSLQLIRRCRRRNPQADVVVTGCLAQRMGEQLRETGARLILGTQYRGRVVELLEQAIAENIQMVAVEGIDNAPYEPLSIRSHEGHTRAVMKIQEGCDNHCTYCIIPSVRGGIRSRPLSAIAEEAAALAQAGFQELVLTGIHLTSYGRDLKNGDTLLSVIRAVHDIAGVERIRLGSLEPVIATADFARALGEMPKLCPQFHLALQSGCDSVLRRMRRRYDTAAFRESAQALRAVFPDCALTTDVMSGFPGETDAEHRQSLDFCREMRFARMHVFPYSEREGTAAATMPDPVPRHIREERARELIALGAGMAEDYRRAQLGTVRRVLFEQCAEGVSVGYTPEYMRCETLGTVCGQTLPVRMTGLLPEGFSGEIVTD